nr:MAG TPA: hypothetical protein [Caudoviricetes sp.]DAM70717.1 MAG TPA: hypothetical protein [Caudoviricetes sp.]
MATVIGYTSGTPFSIKSQLIVSSVRGHKRFLHTI